MYEAVKKGGWKILDEQAGNMYSVSKLSPTSAGSYKVLKALVEEHVSGLVLDAGAGRLAYRVMLEPKADRYIAMDISVKSADLDIVGDLQELPVRDNAFDTIFCWAVIEHVPCPEAAFAELARALKPGGKLIMLLPQTHFTHQEPHDYHRFTIYGTRFRLEQAGLEPISIEPVSGLITYLGHIFCTLFVNLLARGPIKKPVLWLNGLIAQAITWVDERVEKRKLFAVNVIAAATKP